MALKFLKKKTTKLKSFLREYSISLYLSPCPYIINMFGISFETDDYYIFAQEYASAGDLFDTHTQGLWKTYVGVQSLCVRAFVRTCVCVCVCVCVSVCDVTITFRTVLVLTRGLSS